MPDLIPRDDVRVSISAADFRRLPFRVQQLYQQLGTNPFLLPDAEGRITVEMHRDAWASIERAMGEEGLR